MSDQIQCAWPTCGCPGTGLDQCPVARERITFGQDVRDQMIFRLRDAVKLVADATPCANEKRQRRLQDELFQEKCIHCACRALIDVKYEAKVRAVIVGLKKELTDAKGELSLLQRRVEVGGGRAKAPGAAD